MDNTSGALSFDAVVNETDFNESVSDMEKRIKGFASSTEKAGDQMDAAFKKIYKGVEDFTGVTSENLQIQRNVIKEIESNLKTIKDRLENVGPGKARMEVAAQYRELNAELEREKQALYDLEVAVKENEAAHASLYGQLRKIRDEMAQMEASGQRNTEQYSQMQQEAARLTEALADVNRQTRIIGSSSAYFQGIISGLGGVAGAFSAAQGTAGLFARENENLQKIMLKVQSLLAITIGLQQVQQALDKDQAFMLVVVRKAKDALTASTYKLATALGVSNITAKVLMGTLTLGLSVAIGALIAVWDKYSSAQRRAREQDQKFNEAVAENAYRTMAVFKQLQTSYTALGNDMQAKEKFIKSNKEQFEKLGVEVNNVTDAENLLIRNAAAFEQAMMLKAKAVAAMELAKEKYKEWLQEMMDAEEKAAKISEFSAAQSTESIQTLSSATAAGVVLAKKWGEKTILADSLNVEKVKEEGNAYVDEIENFYKELDQLSKKYGFTILPENFLKEKDAFIENLNFIKAQYELYVRWINSKDQFLRETARYQFSSLLQNGASYLEYLTRERDALLNISNRTKEQEENLRKLNDAIAELSKIPVVKDETGDLFSATLKKKKAEYDRFLSWISSTDTILQDSARKEFAGLLTEGENYIEFLTRQRDSLLAKTSRTKADDALIAKYNDEIAQVTKGTVLDDFQKKLEEQIEGAASVLEVIQLIEAERNKITGTTDLEKEQQAILDKAMQDAQKRSKDETQTLLHDYAGYLAQKIDFEKNYLSNKELLTKNATEAQNDEERRLAEESLKELERLRKKWAESSGDLEYDTMVQDYRTYQQKINDIHAEFDAKRLKATEKNNQQLIERLNQAESEAISQMAVQELMNSEAWIKLFSNLDRLTAAEMIKLKNIIEAQFEDYEFTPIDFEALREQINKATDHILRKNPFKALKEALEEYKKTEDETDLKDAFEAIGASIDFIDQVFQSVISSLEKMGVTMDDVTRGILDDINGILSGASSLAAGIATSDPLSIIQGSLDLISSGIDLIWGTKDRKILRSIEKQQEVVDELAKAYNNLEYAISKALGTDIYALQAESIENLKKQQAELLAMKEAEESRKKADKDKIKEYEDAYEEAGRRIEETQAEIMESMLQTTAKTAADQLMDALVSAWESGEDAALAFGETAEEVLKQAVLNAIKLQFIEKPIEKALEMLKGYIFDYDENGTPTLGVFTPEEQAAWEAAWNKMAADMKGAWDIISPYMEDIIGIPEGAGGLTGAIKGVSEETASLVAGQMNAIRMNQAQSLSLMRENLMALTAIRSNTDMLPEYLPHLRNIDNNISTSTSLFQGTGIKVRF